MWRYVISACIYVLLNSVFMCQLKVQYRSCRSIGWSILCHGRCILGSIIFQLSDFHMDAFTLLQRQLGFHELSFFDHSREEIVFRAHTIAALQFHPESKIRIKNFTWLTAFVSIAELCQIHLDVVLGSWNARIKGCAEEWVKEEVGVNLVGWWVNGSWGSWRGASKNLGDYKFADNGTIYNAVQVNIVG